MTEDAMVSLVECPIGLFFYEHEHGRVLCLKTEYGNNKGRIDAYIVASGEFFWGAAPQTIASQRAQMVRPVPLAAVEAALVARPEPEGVALETTAKEREAYAKAAETELVWPEAGFVERLIRDFDRLSAESASLKAKFAEAEAEKAETRKILVRCHDRIHALPRTSDTDLAIAIERLLGRLARGGRHEG